MIKPNLRLKIVLGCSITLIIALGISFAVIAGNQERLIMGQVENEARVLFKQIVITRQWIADHGGIFVEKLPWTKPSQYLTTPEIIDMSGKKYVKETPAMVTKELSKYSKDKELYWFHITSLKLTNPENAPDEFEKKALQLFEAKTLKELLSIETIDNSKYLRYISPLYIEKSCLKCHAKQGYKIGDVRGAISITIPMDKTLSQITANRKSMLVAGLLTVSALMAALFTMMSRLVLSPMRELKSSIKDFSEGKYNPVNRLKTGDEFEGLCLAFSEMTGKLTEYHNSLNDKIHAATKDLKETNAKLEEANRMLNESNIKKSDFIARASHELRTPLTSIKGAMDYLSVKLSSLNTHEDGEKSIDDLRIFFEVIKKNAERLIRMVTGMLDLERIELGVSEWQFADIDLSYLIAEILTYMQVNAEEKGIFFSADIPDTLPVYADEDRIKQVLTNLLSNAIKFSPEGSEISIHACSDNGVVTTWVRDRGPGIAMSDHKTIFNKFYKSSDKEGAGLGLAICKSIIEAHQGLIGVESDVEKGACFYFTLHSGPYKHLPKQQPLPKISEKMGETC